MPIDCSTFQNLEGESLFVQSFSGAMIHYRVFSSDRPLDAPIWLHVHGVTGSWLSAGKYWPLAQQLGYRLIAMDLSNHGQSSNDGTGAAWGCRENEDVRAVMSDLTQRFPQSPVLISASSMGTVAVLRAEPALRTQGTLQMLMLESPFASILDVLPAWVRPFAYLTFKIREHSQSEKFKLCSAEESLSRIQTPTLVIGVASDAFVAPQVSKQVFDTIPVHTQKQFHIFTSGIHTLAYNSNADELTGILKTFLGRSRLNSKTSSP